MCASAASSYMKCLLDSTSLQLHEYCAAIPSVFHPGLHFCQGGTAASFINGLFTWWLRKQGAARIGSTASSLWDKICHGVASAANPILPPTLNFTLDGGQFLQDLPDNINSSKLARGESPVVTSWWTFAWECVLIEVQERLTKYTPLTTRKVFDMK